MQISLAPLLIKMTISSIVVDLKKRLIFTNLLVKLLSNSLISQSQSKKYLKSTNHVTKQPQEGGKYLN